MFLLGWVMMAVWVGRKRREEEGGSRVEESGGGVGQEEVERDAKYNCDR